MASFNVLAPSCEPYGDYRHAPPELMQHADARVESLTSLITRLDADITCLQEVEMPLMERLAFTGLWQSFWRKKETDSDGCLILVKGAIEIDSIEMGPFGDGSGHVAQILKVGNVAIANTHIQWGRPNRIAQTKELLARIAGEPHAVLLGDFNDRPGEPARELVAEAGFKNLVGDRPTAYIANRDGPASLDFFAVRGLVAELYPVQFGEDFTIQEIPSRRCPSDHIPLFGKIILPQAY